MLFTHFYLFVVDLCLKLTLLYPFGTKNYKISSIYLKMSGFSSRNVRYPRYQDTKFLQLWFGRVDGEGVGSGAMVVCKLILVFSLSLD